MKKLSIWILVLGITFLLGWGIQAFYFPIPVETSIPETSTPPPPAPARDITNEPEQKSASPASQEENTPEESTEESQLLPQHISSEKIWTSENSPVDLSGQTMSIKKEEKQGLEIMPGVKVKGGGVNISLDKENTRTLEVRPNSQNQVMLKQKF